MLSFHPPSPPPILLRAAGYETTSSALAFAIYSLARHPRAEALLLQELDAFGRLRVRGARGARRMLLHEGCMPALHRPHLRLKLSNASPLFIAPHFSPAQHVLRVKRAAFLAASVRSLDAYRAVLVVVFLHDFHLPIASDNGPTREVGALTCRNEAHAKS